VAQRQSTEVTGVLKAWSDGDQMALDQLAAKVYRELHGMALYRELHGMARRYMRDSRRTIRSSVHSGRGQSVLAKWYAEK
jgi:hypothetical protein